ncbi:hypothetical protein L1987_04957 [Smallanthus sonchifolius]|uniref:Uncharacterized protein n=1 Tax=Smallanthus sonchifolius TaxID=185202 RepID=A0ACB9JUB5_9ASTR|nr:hypothetical protein L1987_04957 [Smallanthus sonchifolius]
MKCQIRMVNLFHYDIDEGRHVQKHYQVPSPLRVKKRKKLFVNIDAICNHSLTKPLLNTLSSEWCERAFPKVSKLSHLLKGLDLINGRLVNITRIMTYECITKGTDMAQQIVVNCLRFLDDAVSYGPDSTSWMRLAPKKDADS